jgi:fluoride exporter
LFLPTITMASTPSNAQPDGSVSAPPQDDDGLALNYSDFDDESNEEPLLEFEDSDTDLFPSLPTSRHPSIGGDLRDLMLMDFDLDEDSLLDVSFSEINSSFSRQINPQQKQTNPPTPLPSSNQNIQVSVTTDFLDMSPSPMGGPLPMRRVVSSPLAVNPPAGASPTHRANAPRKLTQPTDKVPMVRSGSGGGLLTLPRSPLAVAYSLNRQKSLPVTLHERAPSTMQINRVSSTHSEFSIEEFSMDEEIADAEITMLANKLATPSRKKRANIFRSNSLRSTPQIETQSFKSPTTDGSDDEIGALQLEEMTQRVANSSAPTPTSRRRFPVEESAMSDASAASTRSIFHSLHGQNMQYIAYLSTFAIFGTICRVYLGRLFGLDCEFPDEIHDFLSPLSNQICVTASGTSNQTGGALFVDLPANMIGSFVMGIMTNLRPELWPNLPWLRQSHPLQQYEPLHVAIMTGFCGSLTTFASWNTQMVVMMDGTQAELGHQIVPAIFGYILGLMMSVCSFLFGNEVSVWMNRYRNPQTLPLIDGHSGSDTVAVTEGGETTRNESDKSDSGPHELPRLIVYPAFVTSSAPYSCLGSMLSGRYIPFLMLTLLLTAFAVADGVMNIPFYRSLWLSAAITPAGALVRWQLSKWNGRWSLFGRFKWIPWGTFICNLVACVVSALLLGIGSRHHGDRPSDRVWAAAIVGAIRSGFAGSLSTVSTFVKEIVDLNRNYQDHAKCYFYALTTIVASWSLSWIVYGLAVR